MHHPCVTNLALEDHRAWSKSGASTIGRDSALMIATLYTGLDEEKRRYPNTPTDQPCPSRVAQAQDGPAPTLVVDLRRQSQYLNRQDSLAELERQRANAMQWDPRLGAKTIGVIAMAQSEVSLLFVQGLDDGVDPLSDACLNSAAAAVDVACDDWGVLPRGRVTVHMGDFTIDLEPVA